MSKNQKPAELQGYEMPPVRDFLTETQRDGTTLCTTDVYSETYSWLKARGCENTVLRPCEISKTYIKNPPFSKRTDRFLREICNTHFFAFDNLEIFVMNSFIVDVICYDVSSTYEYF